MKISLSSRIALSSFLASISLLAITNSVSALTWNLSGIFDDGGTIGGSFDYDEGTDTYSNSNITTTAGGTLLGSTYTDDLSIIGNSDGFIIDDGGDFLLTVDFISSLSSLSSIISLDRSTSQEEDFLTGGIRSISSGNVVVAVPFEINPTLGIILLGGFWGISYLRRNRNSA